MDLFSPLRLGDLDLKNRITMAPLTRMRSDDEGVPGDLVAEHYTQRAGLGMIVTEGTFPIQESKAYSGQPGIETDAQVAGWKKVTDSVHAAGGTIVLQLMHGGRVTHTEVNASQRIVGPSAVAIEGDLYTPSGKKPFEVPHALTLDELESTKAAFVAGALNAVRAGFDGVEVHSANGYLLHEFLSPVSNVRDDSYGGSPQNRARYGVEVTRAVAEQDAPASGFPRPTTFRTSSSSTRPMSARRTKRSSTASPISDLPMRASSTTTSRVTSSRTSARGSTARSSSTPASARSRPATRPSLSSTDPTPTPLRSAAW